MRKWLHRYIWHYTRADGTKVLSKPKRKNWSRALYDIQPNHVYPDGMAAFNILLPIIHRKPWKTVEARHRLLMLRAGYRKLGHAVQSPTPTEGDASDA